MTESLAWVLVVNFFVTVLGAFFGVGKAESLEEMGIFDVYR